MRIRVLSDLHLEFADFQVPEMEADVVVLAGDIHVRTKGMVWARDHFPGTPVIYVSGNHEYYTASLPGLDDKLRSAASESGHIHFLNRGSVEIDGVVFLGATLWTDYDFHGDAPTGRAVAELAMNDFQKIRSDPGFRRLRARDLEAVHWRDRRWLQRSFQRHGGKPLVVVTHHPPAAASVPPGLVDHPVMPALASRLESLVHSSGARLWIHGHIHTAVDYRLGDTRVLSNPRGYPDEGVARFRPDLVVTV